MFAFEVYSWPASPFIAPVVSLLRFIGTGKPRTDTTDSAVGSAIVSAKALSH